MTRCRKYTAAWLSLVLAPVLGVLPGPALASGKEDVRSSLPARKAGLWEVTVRAHAARGMGGMRQPPQTVQQCTSAQAEPVMLLSIVPGQENCSRFKVAKRVGQDTDIDGVCSVHGQRVVVSAQLRGDLQSIYSGTYRVEYPGTPTANTGPVDFQGRWLGSCRPGQRPGDMVLPNGVKVNVVDDVGRAERHAH